MPNCWFRPHFVSVALLVCLLLLLLWLLHRSLLDRQARRLHRHMEARLDRLAGHAGDTIDTLVQSVYGLTLKVQAVAARMPAHESLRVMLDEAMTEAEVLLVDGSERGRNLRTRNGELDLVAMLTTFGHQLQSAIGPQCRVTTLGQVRNLAPGVGAELFALGREATLNAFRHARASQVHVVVNYRRHDLQLTISDDGSGLPLEAMQRIQQAGTHGLARMQSNAAQAGALLLLRARNGGGTEWVITLRAKRAYSPARPRRW